MPHFTQGHWNLHPGHVEDKPGVVSSQRETWAYLDLPFGPGEKIVGRISMSTHKDPGWPHVDNEREARANLALVCATPQMYELVKKIITNAPRWVETDTSWAPLYKMACSIQKPVEGTDV